MEVTAVHEGTLPRLDVLDQLTLLAEVGNLPL